MIALRRFLLVLCGILLCGSPVRGGNLPGRLMFLMGGGMELESDDDGLSDDEEVGSEPVDDGKTDSKILSVAQPRRVSSGSASSASLEDDSLFVRTHSFVISEHAGVESWYSGKRLEESVEDMQQKIQRVRNDMASDTCEGSSMAIHVYEGSWLNARKSILQLSQQFLKFRTLFTLQLEALTPAVDERMIRKFCVRYDVPDLLRPYEKSYELLVAMYNELLEAASMLGMGGIVSGVARVSRDQRYPQSNALQGLGGVFCATCYRAWKPSDDLVCNYCDDIVVNLPEEGSALVELNADVTWLLKYSNLVHGMLEQCCVEMEDLA